MTCEQRKDLIPLLALGALDPDELGEIRAHLAGGCPVCEGQLAEANALLELLPLSLPPGRPSVQAKERLMARINGRLKNAAGPASVGWKVGPALAGLAAGLLIAAGVLSIRIRSQSQTLEALRVYKMQKDEEIQNLRRDAELGQKQIHNILVKSAEMVNLKGAEAQPKAEGQVYVDRANHRVVFRGEQLKSLASGKTYELWLVSQDKRKIPMGTFAADDKGTAILDMPMPPDVGPLAAAAVTDEPAGGVPQPTGSFQLIGSAAAD